MPKVTLFGTNCAPITSFGRLEINVFSVNLPKKVTTKPTKPSHWMRREQTTFDRSLSEFSTGQDMKKDTDPTLPRCQTTPRSTIPRQLEMHQRYFLMF